jgi:hypothetical protein
MTRRFSSLLVAALLAIPAVANAWGNSGHRMIGEAAALALPKQLPAFMRTPQAVAALGEYSREPDRLKGSGKLFDADRSPAHFIDLDDEGRILGGPLLTALPPNRPDYETALRAVGQDGWKAGYLPYAILDRYQQLTRDFAYWRVLAAAEANPKWRAHRAWFAADRRRRETQILIHAGELSHFVADGSQPLHVTVHYNGWGAYPNPEGFTLARLHESFEGDLVRDNVTRPAVSASMTPLRSCGCPIEQRTAAYLAATGSLVAPFYAMEKAGGLRPGDRRGVDFATQRMAVGASELRDMLVEAWTASLGQSVGWRPVPVTTMLAGEVDPYPALYSSTD